MTTVSRIGAAAHAEPELEAVERSIRIATDSLLKLQRADGHWVFELEADATIPAEYVCCDTI